MMQKEKITRYKVFKIIRLMFGTVLILSASQTLGSQAYSLIIQNLGARQFDNKNGDQSIPIRLSLKTKKTLYRVGEAIELTVYLENKSTEQPCYVAKNLDTFFVRSLQQGINVSIVDSNGRDMAPIIMVNKIIDKRKINIDDVLSVYLELGPKMIYGVSERLDDIKLKPGTYRLKATYYDNVQTYWSETERQSLTIPLCTQGLISNSVTITVAR